MARTETALAPAIMTPPLRLPESQGPSSKSKSLHPVTWDSAAKSQEYMDSLVPPSPDRFQHIAEVQDEKEADLKSRARDERRRALHEDSQSHETDDSLSHAAALRIQRTFRGYRTRREEKGFALDATTRWISAIREAQFRESTRPRASSKLGASPPDVLAHANASGDIRPTSAKDHWKKAAVVARRAGHDEAESGSPSSDDDEDEEATPEQRQEARRRRAEAKAERKHEARMMGLQYFLEMVDLKHRYGSNLRSYHGLWKKSDTNENFFYWLDYGEGKNMELDSCPRDRLEREQVRYLSREERQWYLVRVDEEGRLTWAKNGARISTTERYKDSIHGIVPSEDTAPVFNPALHKSASQESASDASSVSSTESKREADRAAKYAANDFDEAKGLKKVSHMSASVVFDKLLRKSVRKNTWIFVADTSFRLYVGIKESGAFQHSSFLQGSRIAAAGLIKIRDGRLASLSPLSGHYRPPAANFRAFVKSLKDAGADMSRVSISKSYVVLVGLEAYVKTRRRGKRLVEKMVHSRDKVLAPEEVERRKEEAKDTSHSAELERQFLERQRAEEERQREDNQAALRMMRKLRVVPTVPEGQKDGVTEDADDAGQQEEETK